MSGPKSFAARVRPAVRRRARASLRRALLAVIRGRARLRPPPRPADPPRIRFLLLHAYGMGGTIRTVFNVAGHLAQRYDVEIVSVLRRADAPFFALPPGVTLTPLLDERPGVRAGRLERLLSRRSSLLAAPADKAARSLRLAHDLRLARLLGGRQPEVLIGTRPTLNLLLAETVRPGVLTIGMDHIHLAAYRPALRTQIRAAYPRLTALTVLTERTLADYRKLLGADAPRLACIPNALPPLAGGLSDRTRKVVITAGRLAPAKGFDLLIRAYAPVAADHPDWTLRIFGQGPLRGRLQRLIDELGLGARVRLMPRVPGLGEELARSSIYALSSRLEGLPLVLIEAMSKGVPPVAFDCPTGPAELITPGEDGLLVPAGDVAGLSRALRELIEDAELRNRLGERALITARGYTLEAIGPRWDDLLAELLDRGDP
jgi:glycosyltransferase involved in cell wall biosynthesis